MLATITISPSIFFSTAGTRKKNTPFFWKLYTIIFTYDPVLWLKETQKVHLEATYLVT